MFKNAEIKKFDGLVENKTWKTVQVKELHTDASMLNVRFCLGTKDEWTSEKNAETKICRPRA